MKLNPDFIARQVGSEFVLVPMMRLTADFEGVFTLNSMGAVIWKAIGEGLDEAQISERIVQEYEVDGNIALADVNELIEQLRSINAVMD